MLTCARCDGGREVVEYVEGVRLPVETCDHCGERWVRWRYVEEALNRVETKPEVLATSSSNAELPYPLFDPDLALITDLEKGLDSPRPLSGSDEAGNTWFGVRGVREEPEVS